MFAAAAAKKDANTELFHNQLNRVYRVRIARTDEPQTY
jgi:hypothetical protein